MIARPERASKMVNKGTNQGPPLTMLLSGRGQVTTSGFKSSLFGHIWCILGILNHKNTMINNVVIRSYYHFSESSRKETIESISK